MIRLKNIMIHFIIGIGVFNPFTNKFLFQILRLVFIVTAGSEYERQYDCH